MKTKHLFFATALVAAFTACTNEELVPRQESVNISSRPTVSDVRLNLAGNDADTRLVYADGTWAWTTTDTIGALLMDEVTDFSDWNEKSWLQKYDLQEHINTSYPFVYDKAKSSWVSNAKMLEGNYFFVWPWESYDGNRQVRHSMINQQQTGVDASVRAKSYADNQFFVGYSRIKAGSTIADALKAENEDGTIGLRMTSVLGAIELQITNVGTKEYHINKVVLSGHDDLSSELTLNPTNAPYGSFGVNGTNWFNYANYSGNTTDVLAFGGTDLVYNVKEGNNYNRATALRKVVQSTDKGKKDKSVQLNIVDNENDSERLLGKEKAYVLIMCNPITVSESKPLYLSIYTDEGMVSGINLAAKQQGSEYNVLTDSKITNVGPNTKNIIGVQIDDNSFKVPSDMNIYNVSDLEQYLKWNGTIEGSREITATLMQSVELNKETFDMLKAFTNITLTLKAAEGAELTLASNLPANVLDYSKLRINSANDFNVKVAGTLTLTSNTRSVSSIEVLKGGALNIDAAKANVPSSIKNYGTMTLGANSAVAAGKSIENYGTIIMDKGGDSKASLYNKDGGILKNNGYMLNVTNEKGGTVKMGADAIMMTNCSNEGKIVTANGSKVDIASGSSNGEIEYVDGATITGGHSNKISTKVGAKTINADTYKDKGISKLILEGGTVTISDNVSFTEIEIIGDGTISVNEEKTLSVTKLILTEGKKMTFSGKGTISTSNVVVEKNAVLTNSITVNLTKKGSFENAGTVYNNSYIGGIDAKLAGNGTWKYNEFKKETETKEDPKAVDVRDAAIKAWVASWSIDNWQVSYYDAKDDVEDFADFVENTLKNGTNNQKEIYENYVTYGDKKAADKTQVESIVAALTEEVTLEDGVTKVILPNSTFKTSVDKNLNKNQLIKALKDDKNVLKTVVADAIGQNPTLFETKTKAYDIVRNMLNGTTINFWPADNDEKFWGEDANIKNLKAVYTFSVTKLTDSDVETLLATHETAKYAYIWDASTCQLTDVMNKYMKYSPDIWDIAFNNEELGTVERITNMATLKAFYLKASLLTQSSTVLDVAKSIVSSYPALESWKYTPEQFANYPVLQKEATVTAADEIVVELNRCADVPDVKNQYDFFTSSALNTLLAAFGSKTADVANVDFAISIAEEELSDAAVAKWGRTKKDIIAAANAFVEKMNAMGLVGYNYQSGILGKINEAGTNVGAAMDAYWNAAMGTTAGKDTDYNVNEVETALDRATDELEENVKNAWEDTTTSAPSPAP